jgi:hypothetical protein
MQRLRIPVMWLFTPAEVEKASLPPRMLQSYLASLQIKLFLQMKYYFPSFELSQPSGQLPDGAALVVEATDVVVITLTFVCVIYTGHNS